MNSGCYGEDISNILLEINVVDLEDFNEKTISNEKIKFSIEEQICHKNLL